MAKCISSFSSQPRPERIAPPSLLFPSQENRFVSSKLRVGQDDRVGRHVLAAEDISVGEVLVEEEPLSSVLAFTHLASNCTTCLRAVVAGLGCPSCSQARRIIFFKYGKEK